MATDWYNLNEPWSEDNGDEGPSFADFYGEEDWTENPEGYSFSAEDDRPWNEIYEEEQANNQPPEEESEEPEWVYDSPYSPQWFLDEQQNRLNPEYVSPYKDVIDDETFNTVANYIQGSKDLHPEQWRYGDPGWRTDNEVYSSIVAPMEQKKKAQEVEAQVQEIEAKNNPAPIDDVAEKALADPRFASAKVDTSEADFEKLSSAGKIKNLATPGSSGTDVNNLPEAAKYTQPAITAWMASGGISEPINFIGTALAVPWAAAAAAVVRVGTLGYTYGKEIGLIEGNKAIDEILEFTDKPDEIAQQLQGAFGYGFEKAGGGDLSDWSHAIENIKFTVDHWDEIWDHSFGAHKPSTEYNADVVGIVTANTANIGASFLTNGNFASREANNLANAIIGGIMGEDFDRVERGQVTRSNVGLPGVHQLAEELQGTNAIKFWLDFGQSLVDDFGVTDKYQLQLLIGQTMAKVYGDEFNFAEFFEHELTDPSNLAENQQARALGFVGKVTHDQNLVNAAAANTGSFLGDLTSNVPIIPDIIRGVSKALGNNEFLKTSGGLDEVISQWHQENLQSDVSQLTARDKRFSNISEDGVSNMFTPNRTPDKSLSGVIDWAKNLVSYTDEAKAQREGAAIYDYINVGIDDAMQARAGEDPAAVVDRVREFVNELENPNTISDKSPLYKSSQSVIFNSVKEDISAAVKSRREEINTYVDQYNSLNNNRQVLNTVATALNMTPAQVLDMYHDKQALLTQMIVDKADQFEGKLPGIDIPVESKEFGDKVISMFKPFTGENEKAFHPSLLALQISSSIADGVTETILNKFNIQPQSFVFRFGDMIKDMQSLLLLGLSPSYLANNFVNNVATRTALGYGGMLTGRTINRWMDRFGFSPERFTETMGQFRENGGSITESDGTKKDSSYEKLGKQLRSARKDVKNSKDILNKAVNAVNKVSDVAKKAGVIGKASEFVESYESKQIIASSMMTYMARTWKEGINFRKMPIELEQAIERESPGMSQAIYRAIRGGINMTEVENAIYGTYVIPAVLDSLVQAAQMSGVENSEDFITEYFVKNGMKAELDEALRNKRGDEVGRIVDSFVANLKETLKNQVSTAIASKKEEVQTNVNSSGFPGALEETYSMLDTIESVWLNDVDSHQKIFRERELNNMTRMEFRESYEKMQKNLNERWKNVYALQQQVLSGLITSMGMKTETTQDYIKNLTAINEVWAKYYNETQPQAFAKYSEALDFREGDTFSKFDENGELSEKGTWNKRVEEAYAEYRKTCDDAVKAIRGEEAKYREAMDNAFVGGFRKTLDSTKAAEVDSTIVPIIENINKTRDEIAKASEEARKIAEEASYQVEKNTVWQEANEKRKALISDYYNLQRELYAKVSEIGKFATNKEQRINPAEVDPEASMKASVIVDNAQKAQEVSAMVSDQTTQEALDNADRAEFIEKLKQDLDALQKRNEEITVRIDELTKENDLNKNLDELKNLNNERIGVNTRIADIENRLSDATKTLSTSEAIAPDTWKEELTRKTLYKVARDLTYTHEQAVAYSQLNTARAQNYEMNNPGRDAFKDLGVSVEFVNEERTVPIQGADGQLYQVEAISRADTNTPEFKAWHGNHPENFKNGKPLSVYHGSNAWFPNFSKDFLGAYTGAASAKLGFFFASNKKNSEHYASSTGDRIDLALEYLSDALKLNIVDIYENAISDIEWASKNPEIFPNGLKDYINPDDILNKAESLNDKFVDEFGGETPLSYLITRTKESKQEYEDFLSLIQSGEKKLDADSYEPYWKNLQEYIDSYEFTRELFTDPSEVTKDTLRELKDTYNSNYNDFLDSGVEIDSVFPEIREALTALRYPQTLSPKEKLYFANTLQYYNSICFQLLSDTGFFGVLDKTEMQMLLTGKDMTSENVFGEKRTNADKLRSLEKSYFENAQYLDSLSNSVGRIFLHDDIKENYNRILNTPENPNVREFYLSFNNPYIVDYKGRNRADVIRYSAAIQKAIRGGYDAVILKNTYDPKKTDIYVVFNENQMKSVYNSGEWSDPENMYHQEGEQRIKGQFKIEDGEKIISLFRGADISTLVHETAHGWATTLSSTQREALAAYNGWTLEKYNQLENQFYYDPSSMSEKDHTDWIDAQERFAYGFEQYLLNGVAPNSKMRQIFENFRLFLLNIYKGVKDLVYKGEKIDIYEFKNGVALYQIFDSMLEDYTGREFAIDRSNLQGIEGNSIVDDGSYGFAIPEEMRQYLMTETAKQGERVNKIKSGAEQAMRNETQSFLDENVKRWGLDDLETQELVVEIMHQLGLNQELTENPTLKNSVQEKMSRFPGGEKAVKEFVRTHRETAAKINDSAIDAMLRDIDQGNRWEQSFGYALNQVGQPANAQEAFAQGKFVRLEEIDLSKIQPANVKYQGSAPKTGTWVGSIETKDYGGTNIIAHVTNEGQVVAYVPENMALTSFEQEGKKYPVLGLSPNDPEMYVYMDGSVVKTQKRQNGSGVDLFNAEMDPQTTPTIDPTGEAHNEVAYEQVFKILEQFKDIYRQNIDNALTNNKYSMLSDDTRAKLRGYIDVDVRQDLMNTKYKAGKFGEMMRDAALLNYSNTRGIDNYLTLLFPYQFWMTRSMIKWMSRMNNKGGKMWRRYYKLKKLEELNKKEFMPSRISGKIGLYVPGLPDWMGDAIFMPTDQLTVVGNFMNPVMDYLNGKNADIAAAERILKEQFENEEISYPQYKAAMNAETRKDNPLWQEALAKAKLDNNSDEGFSSLFRQYYGMSLPASITSALYNHDASQWNQFPMTRTGTAWRATFGDNVVGKAGEDLLSLPEKKLRDALSKHFGTDFQYNEFGAFGEYYIRQQIFDMVAEGKIDPADAVQACIEKGTNSVYQQAAQRQREETLVKMQGGAVIDAAKKLFSQGESEDSFWENFMYLLTAIATAPMSKSVVREAETTWRKQKEELADIYDRNDMDARDKFNEKNPNYKYNNLRYESDPEQQLRQYLYKNITDNWYSLDKGERSALNMTFGDDFYRDVINKDTRAIESMDLNRLVAYAQALNGKVPLLATDKLNTTKVEPIPAPAIPKQAQNAYSRYVDERDKLYPGMSKVNQEYWKLPAQDRAKFLRLMPDLAKYQEWDKKYKDAHPDVKTFTNAQSRYYDYRECEKACELFDSATMNLLTSAARSGKKVDKNLQPIIEDVMRKVGTTDSYDAFTKNLLSFILGE